MIFGKFDIVDNAIHTHNDSYALKGITTVSARRPFFGGGSMIALMIFAFTTAFSDLLYMQEIIILGGLCCASLFAGLWLGQLQFSSRDLRNSDLGIVIWGSYRHLNRIRRQVSKAINNADGRNEA